MGSLLPGAAFAEEGAKIKRTKLRSTAIFSIKMFTMKASTSWISDAAAEAFWEKASLEGCECF